VIGNLPRPKVIVLPQIEDLAHDVRWCGSGRHVGDSRLVTQPSRAMLLKPLLPLIEGLPGPAHMAVGSCHLA
jgi:hypothetical protein